MDVIEKAIRNAFEKGDASDQAFRERVYRQAFAALDRVLQANPGVTVESAIKRRKSLQAKIVEIEQEFVHPAKPASADPLFVNVPPLPTGGQTAHAVPVSAPPAIKADEAAVAEAHSHAAEVSHNEEETNAESRLPEADIPTVSVEVGEQYQSDEPIVPTIDREPTHAPAQQELLTAERVVAPERRRRPMAAMFVAVTLFSILAIGIWWAMQTGLLGNTTQSEPVTTTAPEGEDYEPGADEPPVAPGQADAARNWIPVFNGNDPNSISAPGDTSAEAMHEEGSDFVRIRSGASGSAVMIDVNQGVLEQIAGKRATFDIVAKAEEGQDTQMSVTCNFGELGDCGRKRYAVGNARSDFLFELDVPAAKPGAGGTIAINSDFDKEGKSVDIYEIKVSVNQ
ncbi:MAG: hypothetical protein M9924_05985 [Rhizobiaceae bacterium]|nr:hypothetical protein [Rhizobiaceae bacterium]